MRLGATSRPFLFAHQAIPSVRSKQPTGYVYFVLAGEDAAVKIGSTAGSLAARVVSLQTANHRELKLLGAIDMRKESGMEGLTRLDYSALAKEREREIQEMFADSRIRGEWFRLSDALLRFIERTVHVRLI